MVEFDKIKARYLLLRPKIAGTVDLYKNQKLLAEIQLLIKDISKLLDENRKKNNAKSSEENRRLVSFREYLQGQLG